MGKETGPRIKESDIQRSIVEYLSRIASSVGIVFFSIPNEGASIGRSRGAAAVRVNMLKSMGLLPGAADLVVIHRGRALFLEVKAARGSLSPAQQLFRDRITACGCPYGVVRSIEDAQNFLLRYLTNA